MAVQPIVQPPMAESFSGRQRLFKNVWRGIASNTSTKLNKPLKKRKLIRTARIDDDKPPVVLHKFKRKMRAKKMVKVCNKILNYCEEHGLAKHILAKQAQEAVKSRARRKKKRIRVRKTVKGSPRSLTSTRTLHDKCEMQSQSQAMSPQPSKKKIRKVRRKRKAIILDNSKARQNSETMRTWLNVELLKQSLKNGNWPDTQAAMIKSLQDPHPETIKNQTPSEEGTKKTESARDFTKKAGSSTDDLKTTNSLRAIRKRKTLPIGSNLPISRIESIKEVVTPVESSNVLTQNMTSKTIRPTLVATTTKSILKSSAATKTLSKAVGLVPSMTESMDSVQKTVTDYVAYLKTNSKDTSSIEKFKEVMRVVESSRKSTPKRVVSTTLASKTSIPKSTGSISRRVSSKVPTIKDIQRNVQELTRDVELSRVQSMKSPMPLNSFEGRKIIRRVESASYPSSPACSRPIPGTSWRCSGYSFGSAATRMDPYANRKLLPMSKVSI